MKKLALLPLTLLFSEHLTYGFTCIPTSTSTVFLSRVRNASHSPAAQRSQSSQLMAFFNDNQDEEDDSIDDNEPMPIQSTPESLENARQQFELMMAMPKDNTEKNEKELEFSSMDEEERFNHGTRTISKAVLSNLNSPPPLTAILKERRLKEIDLLSSLHSSDNAINELWSLWVAERGHDASSKLLHAEELISVESWTEAEMALLSLVEEHGIHWTEPVNRLATLYYMLGRYEESKALCELVLDIKPWHFGALSGIVLVCTAKNDASGAKFWATQRLPPAGGRRAAWTENAIENAEKSLHEASLVGRDREIGAEEIEFRTFRAQLEENLDSFASEKEDPFDVWE